MHVRAHARRWEEKEWEEKGWDLISEGRQMAKATWRSMQQKHVACTDVARTHTPGARMTGSYVWAPRAPNAAGLAKPNEELRACVRASE